MRKEIKNIAISGLFLGLSVILPVYFHAIFPDVASILSPIHIPILVLGLIVGPIYGGIVGFTAPLLAGLINGMPVFFPIGINMAFECLIYGFMGGLLYKKSRFISSNIIRLYFALIVAMLVGRVVYGCVSAFNTLVLGANTWNGFGTWVSSMFVKGLLGIVIQVILVPMIVWGIEKYREID